MLKFLKFTSLLLFVVFLISGCGPSDDSTDNGMDDNTSSDVSAPKSDLKLFIGNKTIVAGDSDYIDLQAKDGDKCFDDLNISTNIPATFELSDSDGELFELSNNKLCFKVPVDAYKLKDKTLDNIYEVEIEANDGDKGSATAYIKVKVSFPNENILSAASSDIQNSSDSFTPKIDKFELIGNSKVIDGKAYIYNDKREGAFFYRVALRDGTWAKKIYSFLESDSNDSEALKHTLPLSGLDNAMYRCKFNNDENNSINYMCNNVDLKAISDNDTYLNIYACNGDIEDNDTKCSSAKTPVLFIYE